MKILPQVCYRVPKGKSPRNLPLSDKPCHYENIQLIVIFQGNGTFSKCLRHSELYIGISRQVIQTGSKEKQLTFGYNIHNKNKMPPASIVSRRVNFCFLFIFLCLCANRIHLIVFTILFFPTTIFSVPSPVS